MLDAIAKRRSVRKFLKRDVENSKLDEILKAAMYAPSAMHGRPWEFIIVRDEKKKDSISKATPWAGFVKDAPVILVIAAKPGAIKDVWIEDCSIAAENIYLEATNLGLGTCFCQVLGVKQRLAFGKSSEEVIKEVIRAPKSLRILCIMPIGYPGEKKPKHTSSEFDRKKIHLDKF